LRRDTSLSSNVLVKHRLQPWQAVVCATIFIYLALGAATGTVRVYHWLMLLAVPGALIARERGRQFFLDCAPLMAFWLIYDRLRLLQPVLLHRVAVEWPYEVESWAFGWLAGGDVPAHAGRAWLASQAGTLQWALIDWPLELVYLSHLFVVPALIFWLWFQGQSDERKRRRFVRHIKAFTILNFSAIAVYLLLPVAPPWWVSINGMAQPTADLVAQVKMSAAIDGRLTQALIRNAAQWFAAVPSVHGAYPVLLLLLAIGDRNRLVIIGLALYAAAMWTATVMLNQHYIIDLLAGAILCIVAWRFAGGSSENRRQY
jgi:inositol phosphorylceramide synthase catalytic subunit